ncbi:MAG: ATP-binding protein [Chloroflexi bacterium]|nr:ATP-binding protein [Chloroflexota bacterium]
MAKVRLQTGPGVFSVLANVCRSPQEALKQFVENAADAIDQPKIPNGSIKLKLEYKESGNVIKQSTLQHIVIEDNGCGMTAKKMNQVLKQIGNSEKLNLALRGEQGIGLLAFGLIAQELHISSSTEEGRPSSCLVLKRSWLKNGNAQVLEQCKIHQHTHRGTVVYLNGILPEIAAQLTREKIKSYLGQQFASDLRAKLYSIHISDGGAFEEIHSQHFRGVKVMSTNISMGDYAWAFVELYVLPWEMRDSVIDLYGRRGTRICSLSALNDFQSVPWTDHRLEGYIRCDRLKRTADKTAIVQDEVYRTFVNELHKREPEIMNLISNISAESREKHFGIIVNRTGKLIDRFLRYKEKGLLEQLPLIKLPVPNGNGHHKNGNNQPEAAQKQIKKTLREYTRAPFVTLQSPLHDRTDYRSWYDVKQGVICINREHTEFLLSQREDRRCTRYLFSIWAKETLLQEYGVNAEKVADELVGMLAEAEPLLW